VYTLASDGLGEVWNQPARALQDYTMAADKREGGSRGHFGMAEERLIPKSTRAVSFMRLAAPIETRMMTG
jgi:hypothetical protein